MQLHLLLFALSAVAWGNHIVRENVLPGSPRTEWDVNGSGDPSIQGFADLFGVTLSQVLQLRVRTNSTKYRADIYRVGWYQGHGARLVDTIRPVASLPQRQPACHREHDTGLVDCGNWDVSLKWHVPANATVGVYFAKLIREDNESDPQESWRQDNSQLSGDPKFSRPGPETPPPRNRHSYGATRMNGGFRDAIREPRSSHVYFVVRDFDDTDVAEASSRVLFQTSDTTWQAYNRFDDQYEDLVGASTYGSYDPGRPLKRAFKASYNRPFMNRDYRSINLLFGAEYPAIRFLERNGFNVHYATALDTHQSWQHLRNYAVFLSVGHDEYWSGEQRTHIELARDLFHVHMMFWSGNEAYWKIRWEPSQAAPDSQGAHVPRTMVCFKETQEHVKVDPSDEWTGTFRDGRVINTQGSRPENAITGTIFTVNAWRHDPLLIPEVYSKLRVWRACPASRARGVTIVKQGILGHEWDEDLDNGFRPPGSIRLSETHVDNVLYIQDEGSTFDTSSATHHLVLYKTLLDQTVSDRHCLDHSPSQLPNLKVALEDDQHAAEPWHTCLVLQDDYCRARHHTLAALEHALQQGYRLRYSPTLVFGTGTVQWSWGLDNEHDNEHGILSNIQNAYSTRVGTDLSGPDVNVQQSTVNLFADMGVHPETLEPSLTHGVASTDKEPPSCRFVMLEPEMVVKPGDQVQFVLEASDAGDGRVASVEVMFPEDSPVQGRSYRWHPTTRDATNNKWHITWAVPVNLDWFPAGCMEHAGEDVCAREDCLVSLAIFARAVDDSLNVQSTFVDGANLARISVVGLEG